ncbi:stealth conserved region 3 domain-containing protein [Streptomyces sp. SCA3-4]|uniref:stealth conserved region 3 domain-containing protein n=1 Tax=Streptomyces sichuanensis TaxID=2871810 RepID=UPI001CE2568A|nr:stealth conserved region 3 domain-containing protein [Streptomyces sichuanensis]MCA6094765.1 stealth conserved region 3 domain-containing protein [Streptomyces sichuanensis]
MKITFLLTSADTMGGTERATMTLAELLARHHEVEILSVFRTRGESFFDSGTVRVRNLVDKRGQQRPVRSAPAGGPDLTAAHKRLAATPSALVRPEWESAFNRLTDLELTEALRTIDADVLISTTPALMAYMAQLAPRHVLTVHLDHRVSELRGTSGEPLRMFTSAIDGLVSLTERTRDWFAETLGDCAPRLATIGNALPDGYRPRSTLETRTVVLGARLASEKQIEHAIRAFATAAADRPRWTLRVLGDGPRMRALKGIAGQFGVADQVQLVGSTPNMTEEWAKASIAMLTSRVEAFGLVLVEAQAAGVPVIAYDCPNGPAEILTDGHDGLLVPLGDEGELAAALARLMDDDALRHEMGAAALKTSTRFTDGEVAQKWDELLEELAAHRDSGSRDADKAVRRTLQAAADAQGGIVGAAVPKGVDRPQAGVADKAHEVRIEAARPDVRRAGGQICLVREDTTPFEVMRDNLDLAVDVLESLDIPYVLTDTPQLRHTLTVDGAQRDAFLKDFAERYRDEPVYAGLLNERGAVLRTVLAAVLTPASLPAGCTAVRVFRPVLTGRGQLRVSGVYGCDVAFWRDTEDDESTVTIPGGTRYGATLPRTELARTARKSVGGEREYSTVEAYTKTFVDQVDFPIDVVYTWVDGTDPEWLARKERTQAEHGILAAASAGSSARFRSRDELRYSLRSLDLHAPWVRNIYLVTDDQVPEWLDTDHPRVRVVSHREIFGDTGRLPSYNSHAIESRLHRIEGLAEHVLYFNDDVFLGRPMQPESFFLGSGLAKCFVSPTAVPAGDPSLDSDLVFAAAKNNRALIEREFGKTVANTFLHAPHPLRRSTLEEIEERFAEEVALTAGAQFRARTDLAITSSLHHWYGMFTGRSVPSGISSAFVNVGLREHHVRLHRLLAARSHDVFCINDYHDGDVPEDEQADALAVFLASYFPVASQYEKGSVRNSRLAHGAR